MGIWYATREQVARSLEISETARAIDLIDPRLDSATDAIYGLLHRRFYPERRSVSIDFPNYQLAPTWTIELGVNEIISAESIVSGGVTIAPGDYFLRRGDDRDEPPYSRIEIDLSSSAAFSSGTTFQRAVVITGEFGHNATQTDIEDGELGGNINTSVTTLVINPVDNELTVGVGGIILCGTERMIVTNRRMSLTGDNLQADIASSMAAQTISVLDGTDFGIGETILIGAERMRIVDIAGNNLIVQRAYDGSILSAHSTSTDIYALRTFRVIRGALGSTAASHTAGDAIYMHRFPGLVNELAIAEAIVMLEQNASAYARVVGAGPTAKESVGKGLEDLRFNAVSALGRKQRSGSV